MFHTAHKAHYIISSLSNVPYGLLHVPAWRYDPRTSVEGGGMMDLVDGTLLSSSEKSLLCRQSDQPFFTAMQFLGAYFNPSSGV